MSERFAKLFEYDDIGQVAVIASPSEEHEGYELRFWFRVPDPFGVSSMVYDGIVDIDKALDVATESVVLEQVKKVLAAFNESPEGKGDE